MANEYETSVIDIIKRTHNVISVRLKKEQGTTFKAGQYLFVTFKKEGKELSKVFSISNSPTEEGYIEFTKKLSESEFSKSLRELKNGDWARLKLPFGKFTFEGEHKKIAFVSGGIGITPIRSICKFSTDTKINSDIVLLYSNLRPEDIAFKDDLDRMQQENKNLKVIYTITCPEVIPNWQGLTGYINENMIVKQMPDIKERVFYLCGPPKMVELIGHILKEKLGIESHKIITESFAGY
ncbi:MAG: FAD-dependent oxidoreductase [Candidatus Omnitrophota bacterium]|nr:FAD-dependent oxidoreductase [Candidatus Omnitrophota bacterium]